MPAARPHLGFRGLRVLLPGILLVLAGGSGASASGPAGLPAPLREWIPGLELLHSSRTNEALDWFVARKQARREDVCGFYFPALVYTNFDVDGLLPEVQGELGRGLLDEGIEIGQDRLDDGDAEPAARYCLGALYGLRAAERLERSKFVAAAFDAKRARRVMLDLVGERPQCTDCRFWIGSYDYFADVLPGVIKFFRSLLFFPKGNRERGLATLQEVSEHGTLDRYNALWVLHSVYRRLEHDPRRSVETMERVRALYPDNLDALITLAWHRAVDGRPPDRAGGIAMHEAALEAIGDDEAASRIALKLKFSLAALYLNDLQPVAAARLLRPTLPAARELVDFELRASFTMARALNHSGRHHEAVRLLEELRARHPDLKEMESIERTVLAFDAPSSRLFREVSAAWRAGREGDREGAERAFRELRARHGEDGLVHFGMAGMYLDLGRRDDAERHFRAAAEAGIARPAFLLSLTHLRLGNLLDLRDERRSAKSHYRKASSAAGDHDWLRGAAKRFLKEPYRGEGRIRFP